MQMDVGDFVILNGEILPREDARLPLEERATLFGEAIYEVVRFYGGQPFRIAEHLLRMRNSLQGIGLALDPESIGVDGLSRELVERNGFRDATVYWQLGSAAAPRNLLHQAEGGTSFALCYGAPALDETQLQSWRVITVPDQRWQRCDLKTTMLLPNVLARNLADQSGCDAAILHRGDWVTEANTANCFAVLDGVLRTHPANRWILDGVTRGAVLDCIASEGIRFEERRFQRRELFRAEEIFLCGTTTQIAAVTHVDGRPIADGNPGPVSVRLLESLRARIASECGIALS